jgi:cytochrome c oxidase subunit 2
VTRTRWVCLVAMPLMAGCNTVQSVLHAAGVQARYIEHLWWLLIAVCGAMYVLVLAFLIHAAVRHRRRPAALDADPDLRPHPPGLAVTLAVWTGLITLGLVALTFASYWTDARLARAAAQPKLHSEVTGYQWWWRVRYVGEEPSLQFDTANELHLPVGVPVSISLRATDVIHSFWVPNLHGKQDLIPGRDTSIHVLPERTGVFRGQCAEFCGAQHARMAFDVTVESPEDFERWRGAQRQPALEPRSAQAMQGREVFMRSACVMCHAVRGTLAAASVAPDLTHLASRRSLAAGTLPNNSGSLAGWLADPQGVKPGAHMPYVGLEPQELLALVAYLGELQ